MANLQIDERTNQDQILIEVLTKHLESISGSHAEASEERIQTSLLLDRAKGISDALEEPDKSVHHLTSLVQFVAHIARLTPDGETDEADEDGEGFIMEGDDAVETLGGLIEEARELMKA